MSSLDNKIAKLIEHKDTYLSHLADGIMAFWIKHGPDNRHGGFYGGLDRKGNPSPSLPKGLVQHARFLWSFSVAYRLDPQPVYHDMANRSFNFLDVHTALVEIGRLALPSYNMNVETCQWVVLAQPAGTHCAERKLAGQRGSSLLRRIYALRLL